MKRLNPTLRLTLADLLINLAAGWFGAALIIPTFSDVSESLDWLVLISDIVLGILLFVLAYQFRKFGGKK